MITSAQAERAGARSTNPDHVTPLGVDGGAHVQHVSVLPDGASEVAIREAEVLCQDRNEFVPARDLPELPDECGENHGSWSSTRERPRSRTPQPPEKQLAQRGTPVAHMEVVR